MNEYDQGETLRGHVAGEVVFGRYELKKIVGRGGMGVVWLGEDQQLGEEVALKFLSESVRMDQLAMKGLVRETKSSRVLHLAQYNLGDAYATSEGVSKDYGEAAKWYRKAAEQGLEQAKKNLKTLS